jgi:hypothetical protein
MTVRERKRGKGVRRVQAFKRREREQEAEERVFESLSILPHNGRVQTLFFSFNCSPSSFFLSFPLYDFRVKSSP